MALPSDAIGVDRSRSAQRRAPKEPFGGARGPSPRGLRLARSQGPFVAIAARSEGFENIIIDPDPNNGRAVRAYEKGPASGPIPELEGKKPPGEDVLLIPAALPTTRPSTGDVAPDGGLSSRQPKDGEPMIRPRDYSTGQSLRGSSRMTSAKG